MRYSFPSFKYFNSRPHGGRPSFRSSSRLAGYISTHALTEGDCAGIVSAEWSDISTHALTEGDLVRVPARLLRRISTHALTEGDKMEMISGPYGMDFNSRPHGGRRTSRWYCCLYHKHFNSRPHGGRRSRSSMILLIFSFQLTPSRRATTPSFCYSNRQSYFNSRPHGGRRYGMTEKSGQQIFQLTPSRRATT